MEICPVAKADKTQTKLRAGCGLLFRPTCFSFFLDVRFCLLQGVWCSSLFLEVPPVSGPKASCYVIKRLHLQLRRALACLGVDRQGCAPLDCAALHPQIDLGNGLVRVGLFRRPVCCCFTVSHVFVVACGKGNMQLFRTTGTLYIWLRSRLLQQPPGGMGSLQLAFRVRAV